ncbi:MAG TPA: GNAT family N-acetyltransferase [Polyangiaceae bacterium]|nr:GNAT family N-acetyltransferase [Polyangiaceae bacterium]
MTQIRAANGNHIPDIQRLRAQMDAEHVAALPWLFRDDQGARVGPEYWASVLANPDDALLIADTSSGVIGYALLRLRNTPDLSYVVPRRLAVVEDIVVDRDFRRRGVAALLLAECEREARDRGATSVELQVWEHNQAALELYAHFGFGCLQRRLSKPL